jgi:curved DNA-binding protein CbpA
MTRCAVLLTCCVLLLAPVVVVAIEDPFNIFCGSKDCYEVLNITDPASATTKDIKKAYRKLSVIYHPDKNQDPGAVDLFREIAKAVEVLEDDKIREDYDYYLTHPWDYYKVTGKYYFRKLPDADLRLIIAGVVLFLSVLLPVVQQQRHASAVAYLTTATASNLSVRGGGSKQTVALYQRATESYEAHMKSVLGAKFDKNNLKTGKMQKDPEFMSIIQKLVGEVQIEGGHRKPTITDVFAVKLVMAPYWLYLYLMCTYKRKHNPELLSEEEKEEWAIERVTPSLWNDLSRETQMDLIVRRVWEKDVYDSWFRGVEAEEEKRRPGAHKQYKRYMKKNPNGGAA